MKRRAPVVSWVVACLAGQAAFAQKLAEDPITPAEIPVMAAALDAAYAFASPGYVMLAARTATFACNPPADIGMKMGGCSGMRTEDETAAQRLATVRRDIPGVTRELTDEIQRVNQRSARLAAPLPVKVPQELYATDETGNFTHQGNPTFAAYFSRPAFDESRTHALIYLGTMNWTDSTKSLGQYLYLVKAADGWKVTAHSLVWGL